MAEAAAVPTFGRMAKPPEPLNLEDRAHRGEHWRRFARDWRNCEVASKIAEEKQEVRVAALINVIGDEAKYDTFEWPHMYTSHTDCSVTSESLQASLPSLLRLRYG